MQVNSALDSLSFDESDVDAYTPDPMDANKFIQYNDTTFQDGVQWAIFLAIMWTLWIAYSHLDGF
jgi:hypothetical protein